MFNDPIGVLPPSSGNLERGMLEDIVDIAERALWNPAKVADADVQKLAAAVLAHMRRQQFKSSLEQPALHHDTVRI